MSATTDSASSTPRHFGTGWISGTASVALGAIGLGAVLCLHFPDYLTIPDAREHYPLAVIRGLIHLVLVTSFGLGVLSVVLKHNRWLGMLGICLVLVSALLGGSQVPIDGDWDKKDVYLGLDYGLLVLVVYSLVFIPLEKLFGRLQQDVFRRGWAIDLTYFFVSALLVQLTAFLTLQPALVLFGWAVNPTVQDWVRSQPTWLQFLEIMFLADLVQYWVHRMFHEIPWLWKFHAVHHSVDVMDWMAGNRLHLVDLAVTRSLIYVPSYVLGFDQGPLIAYIIFVAVYSVFIHANLRFTFGPLRYLFATPQFHHWHHGSEREAIDKNYAIHLPLLDMLFGTFHLPGDRWPAYYGVHSNDVPESYFGQWVYPFLPKKKQSAATHDADRS